jgi:hypothetical protein
MSQGPKDASNVDDQIRPKGSGDYVRRIFDDMEKRLARIIEYAGKSDEDGFLKSNLQIQLSDFDTILKNAKMELVEDHVVRELPLTPASPPLQQPINELGETTDLVQRLTLTDSTKMNRRSRRQSSIFVQLPDQVGTSLLRRSADVSDFHQLVEAY